MKSSLASLSGAVLIFLIILGAYGMWYARVAEKSTEATALEHNLATKTETLERIAFARATLLKSDDPAHNLSKYFVAPADVVSFISMLEGVAKERGATLEVLSVSDTTNGPATLSFTLGIQGTFGVLMQTLGVIEHAPYALSFSGVTLTKGSKNLWRAEVQVLVGSTRHYPL